MNRVLALFLGIFLGLILTFLVGFFVEGGFGGKVYKYAGGCFVGGEKYAEGGQIVTREGRRMKMEELGMNPFKVPNLEDDLKRARGMAESCDTDLFPDIDFKEKQTQPGVRLNGKWDHLGDEFECDRFPQPGIYLGDNRTRFSEDGTRLNASRVSLTRIILSRRYYFNESFPGLFRGDWVIYSGAHSLSGNFYVGKADKVFPCVSIDGFKRYKLGKCMEMNVLYYPSSELESVIRKRGLINNIPVVCKIIKNVIPKFRIDFDEVNREGWVFIDDDQFAVTEKDYERIARVVQDQGSKGLDPETTRRKNGPDQAVYLQP